MPIIIEHDGTSKYYTPAEYNQKIHEVRKYFNLDEKGEWLGEIQPDLDIVIINGESFTGIGYEGLLSVNTKTYVTEPTRSANGSMANIEDYETFFVPRVKINFKYFSIQDYQRFCNAILPNEFEVEYYDKQFGKRVKHLMYAEPEEMHAIFNVETKVIGMWDYEVSLIGTLNSLEEYKAIYSANGGSIKNYKGIFDSATTYSKGDRVSYNGIIYDAIYYENSFSGEKPLSNTSYWEKITVAEWSETETYKKGTIVYVEDGTSKKYYEAIFNSDFNGIGVSNAIYWQNITILQYSTSQTYYYGDIVLSNNYYRAIWEKDSFSGKTPDTDLSYWSVSQELNGTTYTWGSSFLVTSSEDLFVSTSGKSFVGYNTNADSTTSANKGIWIYPNRRTSVFYDLTLYAIWE